MFAEPVAEPPLPAGGRGGVAARRGGDRTAPSVAQAVSQRTVVKKLEDQGEAGRGHADPPVPADVGVVQLADDFLQK